ncbi:DNA pilot protein [Microviridae sp.]|nr:DNA pilot protein [Microviridae sp.]
MGLGSAIGDAIGGVGSIVGGIIGGNNAQAVAGMNYEAQKEFAQNGIRWKVEDAKRAGIHPLYALGASTNGFTPVRGYEGDYGISDAAAHFGQGFERAQQAKMTKEERDKQDVRDAIQDMAALEDLRQKKRMNDAQIRLADSEIFRNFALSTSALRKTGLPPAMPGGSGGVIPGQGESYATGQTTPEISEVVTSAAGLPSVQAGSPPDARFYSTATGRAPLPTEESGDAMDAAFGSGVQWALRNNLLPYLANFLPFDDPHRRDGEYYDLVLGEYRKGKRIRDYFGY